MLSGVGLAWGVERIVSTLGGVPQAARGAPIAVTFSDPSLSQAAFALADRLRSKGFRVSQGLGENPQSTVNLTLVDHSQGQVSLKHPEQPATLVPLSKLEAHLESNHV
jgi:histidyl-tRNA synthetase